MPTPKMAFNRRLSTWLTAGSLVIVILRVMSDGITGDRIFMAVSLVVTGLLLTTDDRK